VVVTTTTAALTVPKPLGGSLGVTVTTTGTLFSPVTVSPGLVVAVLTLRNVTASLTVRPTAATLTARPGVDSTLRFQTDDPVP
jgi:hypothetical protein